MENDKNSNVVDNNNTTDNNSSNNGKSDSDEVIKNKNSNSDDDEVVDEDNDNLEDEDNDGDDDVDFDEDDTADDDDSNDDKKPPKKQSKEENRRYAEKRRAERDKENRNFYYKGIKEAIGSINPFTNDKMETDEDVELYLTMKEMDALGLDPNNTSDYIKFRAKKEKEAEEERLAIEKKAQEENAQIKERAKTEMAEFAKEFPDVDLNKLLKDESFKKDMQAFIAQGDTLVEAFKRCNNRRNSDLIKTAKEIANKQVKTSSSKSPSMQDGDNNTNEPDWKKLKVGSKEFKEYVERVKRG